MFVFLTIIIVHVNDRHFFVSLINYALKILLRSFKSVYVLISTQTFTYLLSYTNMPAYECIFKSSKLV